MTRSPTRCVRVLVVALAVAALGTAPGAEAASRAATEVLTPIGAEVLRAPHVVTGADGREHLVYEIRIANRSRSTVTLGAVDARSSTGTALAALSGAALASRVSIDGSGSSLVFPPGAGGTVFMDVLVPRGQRTPRRLVHRLRLSSQLDDAAPSAVAFTGAPTAVVTHAPIVIAPPLRGSRWVAATGCCVLNEHRGAILPVNGALFAAQRFAADFVQLTPDNRLFAGPIGDYASYRYYGAQVYSVAAGRVARVENGLPQQVPGQFPVGTTAQNAGGDYIVVRIAPRRYAFYGHLQPDSIKLRVGDTVTRGEPIALLGDSGHSQAPHLHFHVMDGPSPLASNGLPYEFTRFTGQGVVTDESTLASGDPQPVDPAALVGVHRDQLPLNDQILSFGSGVNDSSGRR